MFSSRRMAPALQSGSSRAYAGLARNARSCGPAADRVASEVMTWSGSPASSRSNFSASALSVIFCMGFALPHHSATALLVLSALLVFKLLFQPFEYFVGKNVDVGRT